MNRIERLLTTNHRVVFTVITLGTLPLVVQGLPQYTTPWLIILTLFYLAIGTVGWLQCQRRGKPRFLFMYFAVQYTMLMAIAFLQVRVTHAMTSSIPMNIPLLTQSGQLKLNHRIGFVALVYLGHLVMTLFFVQMSSVLLPAIGFATLLLSILYFSVVVEREEKARLEVDRANQKLTEYAHQAEELAVAKERNRLAREIHDNLGHYLTAVNMQIEAAIAVMDSDKARSILSLQQAQALTREGLSEVRRAVAALRAAPTETRPLHEALMTLVKEHRTSGLVVDYRMEGVIRPCSAQVELTLYRTAQEGLTNIRKHAHASQVELVLTYCNPQVIKLRLQDNGTGTAAMKGGFGLMGIRERVELIGGVLSIETAPGQGFRLEVELSG